MNTRARVILDECEPQLLESGEFGVWKRSQQDDKYPSISNLDDSETEGVSSTQEQKTKSLVVLGSSNDLNYPSPPVFIPKRSEMHSSQNLAYL